MRNRIIEKVVLYSLQFTLAPKITTTCSYSVASTHTRKYQRKERLKGEEDKKRAAKEKNLWQLFLYPVLSGFGPAETFSISSLFVCLIRLYLSIYLNLCNPPSRWELIKVYMCKACVYDNLF